MTQEEIEQSFFGGKPAHKATDYEWAKFSAFVRLALEVKAAIREQQQAATIQ